MSVQHNLNIQNYSLEELLGLFNLNYQIDVEDMKRAKKKVLMMHPDKSRKDPKYFLFYKKAYELIYQFYVQQQKQNMDVNQESAKVYHNMDEQHAETTKQQINQQMEKMEGSSFQNKFNTLFEENMSQKPDPTKNEWFTQENASFDVPSEGVSSKNMGQAFDQMKQQSSGLVKYQGVQNLMQQGGGSSLYDDNDNQSYVSSDPFGKLKFDDLRKVHKDETVFAVSESDYGKMQTFNNVDEFTRARNQHSFDPMEHEKANQMLQQQEKEQQERLMQQEYQSKIQNQQYAEKNKTVLASFLQIKNK